ncbi:hypothetical protein PENTCL1PPCAC_14047, partial [Pristionchus entomophagus]
FYQEFTLDVISKIALGQKDVRMFANPLMDQCRQIFSMFGQSYLSSSDRPLQIQRKLHLHCYSYRAYYKETANVRPPEAAVEQRKRSREAGSPSSGDFINISLDAEVDAAEIPSVGDSTVSRKLVFDEVLMLCFVMLLAGFETTANSLSYLTHFLANNPDVQERIHEEIEAVCPGKSGIIFQSIAYDDLIELKYTAAVIKESLRHYPLASFVVFRVCQKATSLGGIPVQIGDNVLTDTWSMHMDREIWGEDAEEFRPERWLEESSSRPRVAFQSFGEGPRMCIGMRLAYVEEKMAIAHMLKNFRIVKCETTNPIKLVGSLTVAPARVDVFLEKR